MSIGCTRDVTLCSSQEVHELTSERLNALFTAIAAHAGMFGLLTMCVFALLALCALLTALRIERAMSVEAFAQIIGATRTCVLPSSTHATTLSVAIDWGFLDVLQVCRFHFLRS